MSVRSRSEAGLTLVELLVAVSILGTISFALTEAVVLGLRTTDGVARRVSGAAASQVLAAHFSSDVQSAEQVSATDASCVPSEPGVFLHLAWAEAGADAGDGTTRRRVSYALHPPSGPEQDLVRWACGADATSPERRVLGHFSGDGARPPVSAACDGAPCPPAPAAPATVSLSILPDPTAAPAVLTVRRRAA